MRPRFLLVSWIGMSGILFATVSACTPAKPPGQPDLANPEEEPGPAAFADVTTDSGIKFSYRNGEEAGHFAIIESLGGGGALIDFDGDGLLDLFLPGGGYYEAGKVLGYPCKLYRNLGGFKFEDVSATVGLDRVSFPYSHGAAAFDYDGDGYVDLLVTGYNRLVLLHNESDGKGGRRFVDVTKKAGLNERLWSTSAAWGDLDGDGYPELYVSHYGDWDFETNHPTDCTYDGKTRDVCQPRRFKPLPHTLYRNNADGTFTDVTSKVKLRSDGRGIGVLFVDLDNDGRPEIYATNDTDDNFLYRNRGKRGELNLEEVGLQAGVARDDRGVANGSMGVDAGDFDRSGRASVFVTNYENELPALYQNRTDQGKARFTYDSLRSGVAAIGGKYVSWGTNFFDYDLNGWEDILIVSGHAIRFPTKIDRRQNPVLLRNDGGKFRQVLTRGWPYFGEPHNARGAAFGDLDNDGKIDVVVSHLNEPVAILRNIAPTEGKHWLGVRLTGQKGADVVGARVVIETSGGRQTRFVKGGGSYASTNDPRLHFGLGNEATISKAIVYWPSGGVQQVEGLESDAYWEVHEGEAKPRRAPTNR
jgi:hypothetical protein